MHHTGVGTWLLRHTLPWVQIKCVYLWVVVLVVLPKEVWPRGRTIGAPQFCIRIQGWNKEKNDSICPQSARKWVLGVLDDGYRGV